jgi:hypothetical protein
VLSTNKSALADQHDRLSTAPPSVLPPRWLEAVRAPVRVHAHLGRRRRPRMGRWLGRPPQSRSPKPGKPRSSRPTARSRPRAGRELARSGGRLRAIRHARLPGGASAGNAGHRRRRGELARVRRRNRDLEDERPAFLEARPSALSARGCAPRQSAQRVGVDRPTPTGARHHLLVQTAAAVEVTWATSAPSLEFASIRSPRAT